MWRVVCRRALEYLSKIDGKALTDPDPLLNIAVGLLRKQQFAEALKVIDRAIARFPQAANGYFYRGLGRFQAKDTAGSKADLEKYISMAPADAARVAQAKDLLSKMK